MTNDVCMFKLCARKLSFRRYIGSLVFTPTAIYFLATGRIPKSGQRMALLNMPGIIQGSHSINSEYNRDIDQFKNAENYIQLLDRLVQENKGSIKIEKSEIKDMKLPTSNIQTGFKIITSNGKHLFDIGYTVRNKRLPELTNYLTNHFYD